MKLHVFLFCLLPALMAAPSLAKPVTINANDDFATDWANVNAGDQVSVEAGTFTIKAPLTVPSGVSITGVNGVNSTHIVFNISGGDQNSYGFIIAGGAQNVTITGLDISSNHGLIAMSQAGGYSNITISYNNFEYGEGQFSDGTLVFGIYGTVSNVNLQIVHNYFHDSPNSIRNWSIWYASNANFDYNLFYNVNDGGQLDMPIGTVSYSHNYGTLLHRMGQECDLGSACMKFICDSNTFYSYVLPYNDSEGVSIVGATNEVDITNNYFAATMAPGTAWGVQVEGATGGPNRFGYAIEATGSPCRVSNNTLIGPWVEDVSSDIAGANISGNSVYGTAAWGAFEGEPGPFGYGSVITSGNTVDANTGDAPAPPANTLAGPNSDNAATANAASSGTGTVPSSGLGSTGSGSTDGGTTTGGTGYSGTSTAKNNGAIPGALPINGVVVTVTSDTTVTVTWNNPQTTTTASEVDIISTIGRQNFPASTGPGYANSTNAAPTASMDISAMHPGWLIDFTVKLTGSGGEIYQSKPITAYLPGDSVAPWQGTLWGGISVLQTNPWIHD